MITRRRENRNNFVAFAASFDFYKNQYFSSRLETESCNKKKLKGKEEEEVLGSEVEDKY